MKKIFLLFAAACAYVACDPVHEDISNAGHITVDQLKAMTSITVDRNAKGENGNVITCSTSAPVNAKWNIGGKEFIGNYAWKKVKVDRDASGQYKETKYYIILSALCPDGTLIETKDSIICQDITNPLEKFWIYGDLEKYPDQTPFQPGAWDAAAMRFSSTEGAHFPTIPDDVYFGLKTLIVDVSDASPDLKIRIMNGWWSARYDDDVDQSVSTGLWEIPITEKMAKECAKGGEGRDLDLMVTSGSCTINSVYYEE